jgi:hypothetical protein
MFQNYLYESMDLLPSGNQRSSGAAISAFATSVGILTGCSLGFFQNLPELDLIEGNQQVATKPDESFSPSLFTLRSYFATIHHHYYYVFMTARDFANWQNSRLALLVQLSA